MSLFVANVASASHTIELCFDDCQETIELSDHSTSTQFSIDFIENADYPIDSNCPSHQEGCCHHLSYLVSGHNSWISTFDMSFSKIPPGRLISDPHPQGPFQPPRA